MERIILSEFSFEQPLTGILSELAFGLPLTGPAPPPQTGGETGERASGQPMWEDTRLGFPWRLAVSTVGENQGACPGPNTPLSGGEGGVRGKR
jgi:hypothetical protein